MDALFARSFQQVVTLFAQELPSEKRRMALFTASRLTLEIDTLLKSDVMRPLSRMAQQGFAPISFHRDMDRTAVPFSETPLGYTRATHCKYVAALNTVIAAHLNLPQPDTTALVFAGLLHDVGHVALGHKMEWAFRVIDPAFSHEALGVRRLADSAVVTEILQRHEISLTTVKCIIDEQGLLGALQRIADTIAYCFVDLLACGFLGHRDEGRLLPIIWQFLCSLRGVMETGVLLVRESSSLSEILTWRALLYRDNFCALESWRCESGLRQLLGELQQRLLTTHFDPSAFESDDACLERLREMVGKAPRGEVRRMRAMLELPEQVQHKMLGWRSHEFTSKEAMDAWLACQNSDMAMRSFSYVRQPTRSLVKEVRVAIGKESRTIGPHLNALLPIQGPAAIAYEWIGA
ncbi:hypothetical protein A3C17_00685 [Candidatus Uhrbacteria bacterium RIFCSPHIGHO2_02_FULL_53_13]|uniref:HD domain-containing protein n=1 Tax=Candidatus Uhrbacteria bacterium RIFCSPHIGHO2_02_FULL_53_13 TaxID=1802389 RepID=A0A1F7TZT5_9BACT|nr:MAG: hypothetical protein A3C17_00685 [Candidatus Uhrbacteria bacterium RIFCSPHIGHO2_02_FULL_53_13]